MLDDKVEVMRRAGDAINRRDKEAWLSLVDPRTEFRADPNWPESETVRGCDAVWDIQVGILDSWEDAPFEMDEVIDAGNDQVLIRYRQPVRGKTSGVETEFDYWCLGTFREGIILGSYWFSDRAPAFEAAGLSD